MLCASVVVDCTSICQKFNGKTHKKESKAHPSPLTLRCDKESREQCFYSIIPAPGPHENFNFVGGTRPVSIAPQGQIKRPPRPLRVHPDPGPTKFPILWVIPGGELSPRRYYGAQHKKNCHSCVGRNRVLEITSARCCTIFGKWWCMPILPHSAIFCVWLVDTRTV